MPGPESARYDLSETRKRALIKLIKESKPMPKR
ncbi:hypothetical protein Hsar01_00426 [Haloferula sargassicola]|uniref:Uncharacterized protein n=1 Tax=Haloferula sargassicola TaxID=490096 RepID=A0ABP9UPI3_9BACT